MYLKRPQAFIAECWFQGSKLLADTCHTNSDPFDPIVEFRASVRLLCRSAREIDVEVNNSQLPLDSMAETHQVSESESEPEEYDEGPLVKPDCDPDWLPPKSKGGPPWTTATHPLLQWGDFRKGWGTPHLRWRGRFVPINSGFETVEAYCVAKEPTLFDLNKVSYEDYLDWRGQEKPVEEWLFVLWLDRWYYQEDIFLSKRHGDTWVYLNLREAKHQWRKTRWAVLNPNKK